MASIRSRVRADGTLAHAVLYAHDGQQTSATFDTEHDAIQFRDAVNNIGSTKAMLAWGIAPTVRASKHSTAPTLTQWLQDYVKSRTGVTKATIYDYTSYIENDIADTIGKIPLDLLTPNDVAEWVQRLSEREWRPGKKLSGKSIANRHGFLSAALNVAVQPPHRLLAYNPAAGTRIPRTEKGEMVFLTRPEFDILLAAFTERWRPMLRFMVASGARFGELSALKPSDVDRVNATVRIARAWKRTYEAGGYELGPTKTKRSNRTIDIDPDILDSLDYTAPWLFTNTKGGPVRTVSFRNNVWYPSVARAVKDGLTKKPRIHDMRHTCASWMIANGEPITVVQRHLGHESIKTTSDIYGHLDRSSGAKAAKGLGRMLSGSDTGGIG